MWLATEYYEGKQSFRDGYGLDENPYSEGSGEYSDWNDGWEDSEGESQL